MDEEPPAIPQTPTTTSTTDDDTVNPHCPFCTIATHYQPISPLDTSNPEWDPEKLMPPSFVLMTTEHVVAFLDIAPLTRGHVLVAPRRHRVKVGDLADEEMAEIGRLLPLIARSVMKAVLPDIPHDEVDYNIVQNNGPGAAQVIPHVHFHIIPRPPINYTPPPPTKTTLPTSYPNFFSSSSSSQQQTSHTSSSSSLSSSQSQSHSEHESQNQKQKRKPTPLPKGLIQSYIQFGRGPRHELDEDDAAILTPQIRELIRLEIEEKKKMKYTTKQDVNINKKTSRSPEKL